MPRIQKEAIVTHTPEEMFSLVNDVAKYPDFLPWCPQTQIHHQTDTELEATVTVKKGPVTFEFRTRNENTPPESIEMRFIQGPFKALEGTWCFQALGERGCKIEFILDFEFQNIAIGLSLTPVMKYIAETLLNSFVGRAGEIHSQ